MVRISLYTKYTPFCLGLYNTSDYCCITIVYPYTVNVRVYGLWRTHHPVDGIYTFSAEETTMISVRYYIISDTSIPTSPSICQWSCDRFPVNDEPSGTETLYMYPA